MVSEKRPREVEPSFEVIAIGDDKRQLLPVIIALTLWCCSRRRSEELEDIMKSTL